MRRSPSPRSSSPHQARPRHTQGLAGQLSHFLYPREEWALFPDVRSTTGMSDLVRYADAIAVYLLSPELGDD